MKLNANDTLTIDGSKTKVISVLGEGGQGEVYLVNYKGRQLALKLYKDEMSENFKYNLKSNIDRGAPSNDFLWPLEMIDFTDGTTGYLMELRPKNYESFVSYLNAKTKFKDQETLLTWCIQLCSSFKKLHEMGYSYQDLNDGSFFLDKDTGALLICDNDNVTANKRNLGVLGKMRYMAPEIVKNHRSDNPTMPDVHSDRFSLAIILFLALCLGNPFEGECLKKYDFIDDAAEEEMFGTKPVFIYHNQNTSNRPIRGYHKTVIKRWPTLPSYIQESFHRTFVDGLEDRENERTTELEWIKLLSRYRHELVRCPKCGTQYPLGLDKKKGNKCPSCKQPFIDITNLVVGKTSIALDLGNKVYKTDIDKYSSEYNSVIGVVISNKKNPSLWGIKLNLDHDIEIKDKAGNVKVISKGGVIPLVRNLKIKFDESVIGEVI